MRWDVGSFDTVFSSVSGRVRSSVSRELLLVPPSAGLRVKRSSLFWKVLVLCIIDNDW